MNRYERVSGGTKRVKKRKETDSCEIGIARGRTDLVLRNGSDTFLNSINDGRAMKGDSISFLSQSKIDEKAHVKRYSGS